MINTESAHLHSHDPDRRPSAPDTLTGGFWRALTSVEQQALIRAATTSLYPMGTVLWQEGEVADHLIVIVSGYVRVSVVQDGRERIIAFRGPGDIIGERAALMLRQRSATIVALDTLNTLRLTALEFAAFLSAHPRVVGVMEQVLYERMTQGGDVPADLLYPNVTVTTPYIPAPSVPEFGGAQRPMALQMLPGTAPLAVAPTRTWTGQMCSIVFVDVVGFSGKHRTDDDRLTVRRTMYDLLRDAFTHSCVPWDGCHREDRGDGALIIVPPELPVRAVVDPMLARLAAGLRLHNRRSSRALRIQLRLALHVGPVTHDAEGVSGSAVIHTARLLDAPTFKKWIATTQSDLGVITSPFVYENIICDAPGEVTPGSYQQITSKVKESFVTGWMHLSSATIPAA